MPQTSRRTFGSATLPKAASAREVPSAAPRQRGRGATSRSARPPLPSAVRRTSAYDSHQVPAVGGAHERGERQVPEAAVGEDGELGDVRLPRGGELLLGGPDQQGVELLRHLAVVGPPVDGVTQARHQVVEIGLGDGGARQRHRPAFGGDDDRHLLVAGQQDEPGGTRRRRGTGGRLLAVANVLQQCRNLGARLLE